MSGWVCSWKKGKGMFLVVPWVWLWRLSDSTLAFCFYIRQKDDNQFHDITYTRSITESKISWKGNNFSYTGYDTYQLKTWVEHIEQVIDKSSVNSTNSFMSLLYFLHMRAICCIYCKKYIRSQIKKLLTVLVEYMDMSGLTSQHL